MEGLTLRKRADKSGGERALWADEPGAPPGTWPSAGVEIVGDPPAETTLSTRLVAKGIAEGWITASGERVVHRPGGPAANRWAVTHTFMQYDELTVCGVGYRVAHNPDKYTADGDDDTPVTDEAYEAGGTRVDSFYHLAKVEGE
jgi:hypothetical protein